MVSESDDDITLTEEQEAVVRSDETAVLLIAGAGSGKTEVVARRIQRLLSEDASGDGRILGLTYTIKAADELRDRIRKRVGQAGRRVQSDTIHGFAHELVRLHGTRIGLPLEPEVLTRDEDRIVLLTEWLSQRGSDIPEDPRKVLNELDLLRAQGKTSGLVREWESALSAYGVLDFSALLVAGTTLLLSTSARRQLQRLYTHVIVDEAQNLTPAQYSFLVAVVGDSDGGLAIPTMLVGDDKQSIISFAGADPRLLENFAHEFNASRLELKRNFRSAEAVARVASAVAGELGHVAEAVIYAAPGLVERHDASDEEHEGFFVADWVQSLLKDGLPLEALSDNESRMVREEEIAVLARSATALRYTSEALRAKGIEHGTASNPKDWLSSMPGRVVFEMLAMKSTADHRSTHWELGRLLGIEPAHVSSLEALEGVLSSREESFLRMLTPLIKVDDPARFLAELGQLEAPTDAGDAELASWQADVNQLCATWRTFLEQVDSSSSDWAAFRIYCSRQQRGEDQIRGVRLLTVHKAQGREFKAVALVGLNEGQLPDFRAQMEDEVRSELRTFYVAITRAQRVLLLCRPNYRNTRYGPRRTSPSRFLEFVESK